MPRGGCGTPPCKGLSFACYKRSRWSRKALAMTESELKVIAALAQIGLMRRPTNGYSAPAAIGTPTVL